MVEAWIWSYDELSATSLREEEKVIEHERRDVDTHVLFKTLEPRRAVDFQDVVLAIDTLDEVNPAE